MYVMSILICIDLRLCFDRMWAGEKLTDKLDDIRRTQSSAEIQEREGITILDHYRLRNMLIYIVVQACV